MEFQERHSREINFNIMKKNELKIEEEKNMLQNYLKWCDKKKLFIRQSIPKGKFTQFIQYMGSGTRVTPELDTHGELPRARQTMNN